MWPKENKNSKQHSRGQHPVMQRKSDTGRRETRGQREGSGVLHWDWGGSAKQRTARWPYLPKSISTCSFKRSPVNKYHKDSGLHRKKSESKHLFNNPLSAPMRGEEMQIQTHRMYPNWRQEGESTQGISWCSYNYRDSVNHEGEVTGIPSCRAEFSHTLWHVFPDG